MVRGGEVLHRSITAGYFSEREGSDVGIGIIIIMLTLHGLFISKTFFALLAT